MFANFNRFKKTIHIVGKIDIFRPVKQFDEADNLIETRLDYVDSVLTSHMTISGYMRLLDPGLLPSSTKEFRIPICNIKLLDRIVLDDEFFLKIYLMLLILNFQLLMTNSLK